MGLYGLFQIDRQLKITWQLSIQTWWKKVIRPLRPNQTAKFLDLVLLKLQWKPSIYDWFLNECGLDFFVDNVVHWSFEKVNTSLHLGKVSCWAAFRNLNSVTFIRIHLHRRRNAETSCGNCSEIWAGCVESILVKHRRAAYEVCGHCLTTWRCSLS